MRKSFPEAPVPTRLRRAGWTGEEVRAGIRWFMRCRRMMRFSLRIIEYPVAAPTVQIDHPFVEYIDLGGEA